MYLGTMCVVVVAETGVGRGQVLYSMGSTHSFL